MEIIYEAHGIEIVSKDEKILIRYDAGIVESKRKSGNTDILIPR